MAHQSRPALQSLPLEILNQIAFELVALQPLGPPCDLLPLLLTSSHFHHALSPGTNPVLFARIFRHKFDTRAVERRAFAPSHLQCLEQLVLYCRTMQVLRAGNVYVQPMGGGDDDDERDAVDALFTAFMMMLEDDGKNARQLQEWACADVFAERFVRRRLFENQDRNDGWPIDNAPNSCALWLMWMLTTEEKLRKESDAQREQMIQLLLPFVFISLRYASSEAPPHFYTLPRTATAHFALPQSIASAHGPYPVYPPAQRDFTQVHYGARPNFSPPLAAPAAKLLYFARRELQPLPIAPHLAPDRAALHARGNFEVGPTAADMHELNWSWTARLPLTRPDACAGWGAVPPAPRPVVPALPPRGGGSADPASRWFGKAPSVGGRGEKSREWDADWWRLRFCGNVRRSSPTVRYGRVYEPGCMDGLWVGRMLVSSENVTRALMAGTEHPGAGTLNDLPPYTMQAPVYMRLREAHSVQGEPGAALPCGGSGSGSGAGAGAGANADANANADGDEEPPFDDGIANAWFAGRVGGVRVRELGDAGRGAGKRVLVEADGGRGVYRCWDASQAHGEGGDGGEWTGYEHDAAACGGCRARAEIRARNEAAEREEMWRSVGLGLGGSSDEEEEYEDEDEEGEGEGDEDDEGEDEDDDDQEDDNDDDGDGDEEGDDDEGGEDPSDADAAAPDWDSPLNADERGLRAHDRRKVLPCDGVRDIVLFGSTDERHGQAFNHFTYYGRVRPWDGLIGILSKARDEHIGHIFFYGYLVGGTNFVGNWRFAGEDPAAPAWECAFAMSRRED